MTNILSIVACVLALASAAASYLAYSTIFAS
jgi:hypothetical protein